MTYYLIWLHKGRVVLISSYDDEETRDKYENDYATRLRSGAVVGINCTPYDEIQTLNEVC